MQEPVAVKAMVLRVGPHSLPPTNHLLLYLRDRVLRPRALWPRTPPSLQSVAPTSQIASWLTLQTWQKTMLWLLNCGMQAWHLRSDMMYLIMNAYGTYSFVMNMRRFNVIVGMSVPFFFNSFA